jgi:hypothetical protein
MPLEIVPPTLPFRDPELEPHKFDDQTIGDALALSLVVKTFNEYEAFRKTNHDCRWQKHDKLRNGDVPQRKWEGTDVPKVSLGIPIVFDQEESLVPALIFNLFGQDDWFEVEAVEGLSTPEEARLVQRQLLREFKTPKDFSGRTALTSLFQAVEQLVHYGTGGVEVGYVKDSGLLAEWIDIRDLYMDPTLVSPWIDDSKSVIQRKLLTVEKLNDLRDVEGMRIPSLPILNFLAKNRQISAGDYTKQIAESYRGGSLSPGSLATDPAKQEVEVLIHWTPGRTIWTLGRAAVAFNAQNKYGFLPFSLGHWTQSYGHFYGLAPGDVLEGEQALIQGVTNARLDELSLALRPPRWQKKSAYSHPSSLSWKPGQINYLDNPRNDIQVHQVSNITQSAYVEAEMAGQRAQRRTGISELSFQGSPTRTGASRTATGVQAQVGGGANRLSRYVLNIENFLIVPFLYKSYELLRQNEPLFEGKDRPFRFAMHGATRMMTREKLQSVLGPTLQSLLNGQVMQMAATNGKILDFEELQRFMQDATGTRTRYTFYRDATPEEQQARQQPDPETAAKLRESELNAKTRLEMGRMKAESTEHATAERSAVEIAKILGQESDSKRRSKDVALQVLQKAEEGRRRDRSE